MFLKVSHLVRMIDPNLQRFQRVTQSVFVVNHISKRNAGHSEWANRKSTREANMIKKESAIARIKTQLQYAIIKEKSANPALNRKLQAVIAEARKASISQSTIDKLIKPFAASFNQENIRYFLYSHSLGISCVIDVSSIHPADAKGKISNILKKFGFRIAEDATDTYKTLGVIYGKKSENVENSYDKAVEDAIQANCEEVIKNDDGKFSFICHPQSINACIKSLTDLGYVIDYSETQHQFLTYTNVDDTIRSRLEEMEAKLGILPEFVKLTLNIK